jgi:hypothetical protein
MRLIKVLKTYFKSLLVYEGLRLKLESMESKKDGNQRTGLRHASFPNISIFWEVVGALVK